MRDLPTDPFAFQARAVSALCDDLFDMGAGKSRSFRRLDALREVSKQTKRDAGRDSNRPATDQ